MSKEADRSVRNLKLKWQNEPCYHYADKHTQASISYRASSLQALAQRIDLFLQYGSWSTVDAWLENRGYRHGESIYGYSHGDNSYVLKALELSHVGSNDGSDPIECSITVPPLEAVILENSQSQYDVYINACGPIWGTAYAPEVRCRRAHTAERVVFEKHIAVGVTRIGFKDDDKNDNCCGAGSDSSHYVGEEETYDNLLEIWVVKGTIHSVVDDKVKTEVSSSRHVHRSINKKRDPNVIAKIGRPRKYPLVEAEVVVVDGPKVVRKRGRPRKHPINGESVVVEELLAVEEEGTSAEVKSMTEDLRRDGDSKQKKNVARGKKQNNKYILDDSDSESEGSVYDSAAAAAGEEEDMDWDTNILTAEQSEVVPEEEEEDDLPVPHHASLSYCVELKGRGPIWGLSWAPSWSESSSPSSPSASFLEKEEGISAAAITAITTALDKKSLGLLATVCGDGCCLILLLPRDLSGNRDNNCCYDSSPVIDESDVKVTELRIHGVMVTCVAWSCHQPFKICCGMSDGSVTIWDIESSLDEGN